MRFLFHFHSAYRNTAVLMSGLLFLIVFCCIATPVKHPRSDSLVCHTGRGFPAKLPAWQGMVFYRRHLRGECRPILLFPEDCTISNESFCCSFTFARGFVFPVGHGVIVLASGLQERTPALEQNWNIPETSVELLLHISEPLRTEIH